MVHKAIFAKSIPQLCNTALEDQRKEKGNTFGKRL